MKTKLTLLLVALLSSPAGHAMACSVCFGAKDSQSTKHMAIAIWFMMGAVMSVLGGFGAFGLHLWRHANTPLEPHQQIVDEDLKPYE